MSCKSILTIRLSHLDQERNEAIGIITRFNYGAEYLKNNNEQNDVYEKISYGA